MSTEKHDNEYFEREGAKEYAAFMRSYTFEHGSTYSGYLEHIDDFITETLAVFLASYEKEREG